MVGTRENPDPDGDDGTTSVNENVDNGSVGSNVGTSASTATTSTATFCRTPSEMYGGDKPLNFQRS